MNRSGPLGLPAGSIKEVKFEFCDAAGKLVGAAARNDNTREPVDPRFEGRGFAPPPPPKPSKKKCVNQFAYTIRYADARTFRGMITWAGRGNGSSMARGMYRVPMTAGNSAPVSYDFRVLLDSHCEVTEADRKQLVRDKITAANQGVIGSRNIKSALTRRAPKIASVPAFEPLAKSLADSLLAAEDSIFQTKNQSGQDPLNFPIHLNAELGGLMAFVTRGERRPANAVV